MYGYGNAMRKPVVLLILAMIAALLAPGLPARATGLQPLRQMQAATQPPNLDTSFGGFGSGGALITQIGPGDDTLSAIAIQPADGKIVAVGYGSPGFEIARFRPDGSPDPSFGGNGRVSYDFGSQSYSKAFAVAIQNDGKIVVAGDAEIGGDFDFAIARVRPDGSLDPSFGGDGKVTTGIGGAVDRAQALVIQPDGKIVAGGKRFSCSFPSGCDTDFALARYNPDGSLDTSFDSDGKTTAGLGGDDIVTTLVVQDDGKIVAGGFRLDHKAAVARFLPNGKRDSTFDGDGLLSTGVVDYGNSVLVQPDHKILVTGDKGLLRLNANGSADPTFGSNGVVSIGATPLSAFRKAVVLPNGKILVAGEYQDPNAPANQDKRDFALARFSVQGKLDTTFGGGQGYVMNPVPPNSTSTSNLADMALLANGQVVAAGNTHLGQGYYVAMARYFSDGSLDAGGRVMSAVSDFANANDSARAIVMRADGRVIAAGSANAGAVSRTGAARYLPDGALDSGFGSHGLLRSGVAREAHAAAVDAQGSLFIAASRFASSTGLDFVLMKFKPDGSALAPGFGPGGAGFVATDIGGADVANALALLPGGGFAVAGSSGLDFAVVRSTSLGLPDPTFGKNGIVKTDLGAGSVDVAYAALAQPDGKILVAGTTKAAGSEDADFAIARYNPDGSLDPSFGGDGIVTTDFRGDTDTVYDLALQGDGKILAGGTAQVAGTGWFAIARYNPDGALDTSNTSSGTVLIHAGQGDTTGYALGLMADGRIAIAGCAANLDRGYNEMALSVLTPDFRFDPLLGRNGVETIPFGGASCARDLAVAPGTITLAGFASDGSHDRYALARVRIPGLSPSASKVFLPVLLKSQ